jgi:hypothetical protein
LFSFCSSFPRIIAGVFFGKVKIENRGLVWPIAFMPSITGQCCCCYFRRYFKGLTAYWILFSSFFCKLKDRKIKAMKAAQVQQKGGEFVIVDIDKPSPKENEVLIKIEACGICHSDAFVKDGTFPGSSIRGFPATRWWGSWKKWVPE